jgi:hypothetical protein
VFGLAPPLVVMFDTIAEFSAAIGTWGFAVGFAVAAEGDRDEGGGLKVDA